jgi:hypothetical protein
MAASVENSEVLEDLIAQRDARRQPDQDVLEDLDEQRRLRMGDYPLDTIPGMAKGAYGVFENFANMITGFASAIPGAVGGLSAGNKEAVEAYTKAVMETGSSELAAEEAFDVDFDVEKYPEGFHVAADPTTFEPRTLKGEKYQAAIADAYNEYIEEKWGEYLGELVDQGIIDPKTATWSRTSADALLMGLLMRGGKYARDLGKKAADMAHSRRIIDLDAEITPLEGELIPGGPKPIPTQKKLTGPQKRLPAPEEAQVTRAVREALDDTPRTPPTGPTKNIFKNRQAGAIDPGVFAEGVARITRPAIVTAKSMSDVSHALARQVGFKMVTDIRKQPSPTAKMLADRIMPLENSTITLGGGFHELISVREGEYNTRINNILEPLRKQVVNKNAARTLRLIALPKRINDDLFNALDTGKVPEYLAPVARAIRAVLNDMWKYEREAGVDVGRLPNYLPHMWNANKIRKAEFGKKRGGEFTKYLMEKEGLPYDVAQDVIATITHEEGFLDFVEDAGGRLGPNEDYSLWAGRVRQVGGGPSKPAHTKHRVLKGNFPESRKWLNNDVESVLASHVNRAVRHAEYTRIAGPGESKLNKTVRQIIEEVEEHATEGGKCI